MKKLKLGFSLTEFILVVAIIAMVSVTIGISLSSLSPRKLENEVQKLVGDLAWARSMSISTHNHYRIDFDIVENGAIDAADLNTYIIYRVDPTNLTSEVAVKRRVLNVDGIDLIPGVVPPSPLVEFDFRNPQGSLNDVVADPLIIQLWSGSDGVNITIRNLTGHVSWERL